MVQQYQRSDELLIALRRTVLSAALFSATSAEQLADGFQTAHEVLAHLVFWHREYVAIAQALASGRQPELRSGTIVELNARAYQEFAGMPLPALARCLVTLQELLEAALWHLPDWEINFPVQQGGRYCSIDERLLAIESHIHRHVARLRNAARQRSHRSGMMLLAREVQA